MHNMKIVCVGGGVIGGGWAARFALNGHDVTVCDLDPEAGRKINQVLENARLSYPQLYTTPLPTPGTLSITADLAQAVAGAGLIIESVPERLELKHRVYAAIEAAAPDDAIIGSSTSGFKPSQLRQSAARPQNIIVTHPFNPVYLLPLVELVGVEEAKGAIEKARTLLEAVGMKPLVVRKEIDAHIADRLLEAVWREGLWLIKDDIATTAEIDDAIRYGFGLRWAQMGLFETYRVAGGEDGMAHFIAQFGPTLTWPWTKLMDVPELDDDLTKKIADQSDAQSGQHSIRELERIRDRNLVGILQVLKGNDWGAGETVNRHEERLNAYWSDREKGQTHDYSQPLRLVDTTVHPSWTDYNGHMTESRYLYMFSLTSDAFLRFIGSDADYVASGFSYYSVETHIMHRNEVRGDKPIYGTLQLVGADEKRLHIFMCIHHGESDELLASGEQILLHVDINRNKACAAANHIQSKFEPVLVGHSQLPVPDVVGRHVGQRRN